MKNIAILSLLLMLVSCDNQYKYRIVGKVQTSDGLKDAVWHTDTFFYDSIGLFYTNSDGSIARIYAPYTIEQ